MQSFDCDILRRSFPILAQEVHGRPLVYLDNAATSQKPLAVLEAIERYYKHDNANVHRAAHDLSRRATEAYEAARQRVAQFLNAQASNEIVFTRGTTESINLVAQAWGDHNISAGDTILLTEMEHHSNIVPWQLLTQRTGAKLAYVPVTGDEGLLDLTQLNHLLQPSVKIFAFTHISNTLGTINPVRELCALARERGVTTLIDAAQSAGHLPIDVREIGCDFLAFSAHKMCGPTGIGVLYGRAETLEKTPPYQGGGEMISSVDFFASRWNVVPHKFEAGTPDIAGAIGLHAAMDYIDEIGRDEIHAHDQQLATYAYERLAEIPGIRMFGPPPPAERGALVSFLLDAAHAHDVVTIADQRGIALRGGHHCNQPLMRKLGIRSTARASFYLYNTRAEVDALVDAVCESRDFFSRGL